MADNHEARWYLLEKKREKVWINVVLFVITFLSTLVAGVLQMNINPLDEPGRIGEGLPFALPLMVILLSHELGHYIVSKNAKMEVSLPYFLPAPSIIGTFGAFIKMRSPIISRRSLLDIGAAGPLIGFMIAVPFIIIGFRLSEVRVSESLPQLSLGTSLLLEFMTKLVIGNIPDNYDIIIHPIAFAGWIGLFVTSINLLPVGQLDGGHIAYALFGKRHKTLSIVTIGFLTIFGFFTWPGWFIWAVLLIIMGLRHPPPMDDWTPLDNRRKVIGFLCLVIFVITFIPVPFEVM